MSFSTFEELGVVGKKKGKKRGGRWMQRTGCRGTSGVTDQIGMREAERGLFCPCAAMEENQACSASNFHMSISAQLRNALWNQSSRKYP